MIRRRGGASPREAVVVGVLATGSELVVAWVAEEWLEPQAVIASTIAVVAQGATTPLSWLALII